MNRSHARWLVGIALAVLIWSAFQLLAAAATTPLFFGVGVVGAFGFFVMRDLFAARDKLKQRQFEEAFVLFERFEKEQLESGWKRVVAFMFVGVTSTDGVAVARNGMGSVRLDQLRFGEAEQHFQSALERDPKYAMPLANLAILSAMQGDVTKSKQLIERAVLAGASRKNLERAIAASSK